MWRRIEQISDLPTDSLFLVGVPPNIVGCGMIERGKLVWPCEGDSEEINGAEWWMPILAIPEQEQGSHGLAFVWRWMDFWPRDFHGV